MKKEIKKTKYQHIVTWCKMMGSFQYYTDRQIEKAEQLNVPENTIYFKGDTPVTFDEVTNPEVINYFNEMGLK